MANLKEIRNRMASVKTTRQVTSAMKMVSAAKLRRAQEAVIRIRPYADKLNEILGNLSESLASQQGNPYITDRGETNILLVIINSNRGLCGAFNANINKAVMNMVNDSFSDKNLSLMAIGKNAYDFFRRRDWDIDEYNDLYNNLNFENVAPVVEGIMSDFVAKKYDRVFIVYNEFVNAATQNVRMEQLLPIVQLEDKKDTNSGNIDYIYEPSQEEIVNDLIPRSLKIQFYKALLDSNAAEHGARMTAMHQATDNATNLLRELNLQYNKARQASITNEILEIVSGAEALKG